MTPLRFVFILISFGFVLSGLGAQSVNVDPDSLEFPIASMDDQFSPYGNPSLLGTGQISGLGYAQNFDNNDWIKQHWVFYNSDGFSYVYENRNDVSYHNFAVGSPLSERGFLRNLYFGSRYSWRNSATNEGWWRNGLTFRPHNSASLAMVWDNPYRQSPAYKAGIAIRPLSWFAPQHSYRLELSGDISYKKVADETNPALMEYDFTSPVLGFSTQIVDGFKLGGSYNLDSKSALLNFSLRFGKTELGSLALKPDGKDPVLLGYVNAGDLNWKPFLGLSGKKWYDMKLRGEIVSYKSPSYSFGPFRVFDSNQRGIDSVINELEKAAREPGVEGILLINPSFSSSFALQQELVRAFASFKAKGKKVECYYDNISNGGYIFAASVADNIWLNPMGSVDLHGLSITSPYFATLLDSLGVEVLNFRSHKYKSAGNQFSETSMTEAEQEVYDAILQTIYEQMIVQINNGRGSRINGKLEDVIDNGPYYLAQDAMAAGLVDSLIYQDQLEDKLKDRYGFTARKGSLTSFAKYDWNIPSPKQIAVIYASGNIVMGKGEPGTMIAAESTVKLIRAARKNPAYKGIILRVDSGGGSAQASDIILRELELAQTENKKPVVVSMAGMAASGGYYIACKADKIVAEATTLTGSIGVIGIAFNAEKMFNKVRVNWSTVKKGRNADFPSIYRKWTEEEKQKMTGFIESVYEDFVGKVDTGRKNLDSAQVHAYAQGRVWTGKQALELGLIDDLGGMETALIHMRDLTGIKGDIELVDATSSNKGIRIDMRGDSLPGLSTNGLLLELEKSYGHLYELWKQYSDQSALMLTPVSAPVMEF